MPCRQILKPSVFPWPVSHVFPFSQCAIPYPPFPQALSQTSSNTQYKKITLGLSHSQVFVASNHVAVRSLQMLWVSVSDHFLEAVVRPFLKMTISSG